MRKVAVDGTESERRELSGLILPGSELTPYLKGFLYMQEGVTTGQTALQYMIGHIKDVPPESVGLGDDPDVHSAMVFVDVGYQAGNRASEYGQSNRYFDTVASWVTTAPETKAIASLCRRACGDGEMPACANTAFGLLGGYYEVIRFDSPLEAVIPQDRFLSSPRAVGMTLRRIAFSTTEAGEDVFLKQDFSRQSECLADAVAAVRAQSP